MALEKRSAKKCQKKTDFILEKGHLVDYRSEWGLWYRSRIIATEESSVTVQPINPPKDHDRAKEPATIHELKRILFFERQSISNTNKLRQE